MLGIVVLWLELGQESLDLSLAFFDGKPRSPDESSRGLIVLLLKVALVLLNEGALDHRAVHQPALALSLGAWLDSGKGGAFVGISSEETAGLTVVWIHYNRCAIWLKVIIANEGSDVAWGFDRSALDLELGESEEIWGV